VTGHPKCSQPSTTPSHPRQLSPTGLLSNGPLSLHSHMARETHKNEAAKFSQGQTSEKKGGSSPLSLYMQEASYEAFWPLLPLAAFTILFAFRLNIRFVHKIWLKIAIHVNNAQFCMSNIVNAASKSKCLKQKMQESLKAMQLLKLCT